MAAMSGEDAARAHALLKNNILVNVVSEHGFHIDKPREFVEIMVEFLDRL